MMLRLTRIACFLFLVCIQAAYSQNANERPQDEVFPSPDGKWEVRSTWISDSYRRDFKVINRETGKSYFGMQGSPDANEVGPRRINVLWSPDSRFASIYETLGRSTHEGYLIAIQNGIPEQLGKVWEKAAPDKEGWPCCLLKENDKKRWSGVWYSAEVEPVGVFEWLNDRDFVITMEFSTDLRATKKEPLERLRIATTITLRMNDKGGARIIAGKYDRYEKTSKGTPADWDAEDEKENRGLPLCTHQ